MCKQISGAFFQTRRYVVDQIFVLTACNVATGRSFAKCGHHRLRTLRALFGGRGESRVTRKPGGFDLKVIPIANPPRRIGQPTTFPSQTPYTWRWKLCWRQRGWGEPGISDAATSVAGQVNTRETHLKFLKAHFTTQLRTIYAPTKWKNRRTWHPGVTAILSLQGAQAGKGQLGKLHHRTHGPRWFPTGFFSPINNGLNWCIGKHCGAPGILLLKLELKNGLYIHIYIWFYSVCTSKSMILYENISFQWQCCLTRMFLFFSQHWNLQGEPDDRFWSARDSFILKKWLKISGFAWGYILYPYL